MACCRTSAIVMVAVGLGLLSGCQRNDSEPPGAHEERPAGQETVPQRPETVQPAPTTPPAPATPAPGAGADAGGLIAAARCEREQRCGNVGSGKQYVNLEVCIGTVREEWKQQLSLYQCAQGFDERKLDKCLDEFRDQDCNEAVRAPSTVDECRTTDICKSE